MCRYGRCAQLSKKVAGKAIEKKVDYVLALKSNHPVFSEEVRNDMDALSSQYSPGFEQVEKDHGPLKPSAAGSLILSTGTQMPHNGRARAQRR